MLKKKEPFPLPLMKQGVIFNVVSGELSRGTMEMLLAQPVSRRQVYWQHMLMTTLFLVLMMLICWFGMALITLSMVVVTVTNLSLAEMLISPMVFCGSMARETMQTSALLLALAR